MLAMLALPLIVAQSQTETYGATWDVVRSAISGRYYARTTRKAEMGHLLDEYGPKAKAARDRSAFGAVVNSMIDDFKDSHFAFYTTDDQGFYAMDSVANKPGAVMPNIGAWFAKSGSDYTVQMIVNGTEAEKAGLRKGDVMVKVDDRPFAPVESFRGKKGKTVALQILRDGKTVEAKAEVSEASAVDMFLRGSRDSSRVIEHNGCKIGYFRLWMMINDDFKRALSSAVYGSLRNTDAFVLDLRDGFGGRPEEYADPFFRPEVVLEWNTSPTSGYKQLFGYQRPLVVLINEGTRSAKEVLAFILQKSHRATLVGVHTKGQVLGTWPQKVNDWSYLEIPQVEVKADGIRLEGTGVAPDIAVQREYGSDGTDLALAAALKKLESVSTKHGQP